MHKYISIAGTMGVGKTTMVKFIADEFGWEPLFENFKHNPFLTDFYTDMKRWAFHSQTFFLLEKTGQLHLLKSHLKKKTVIQDTPIYEDVYAYARTLYKRKQISIHEWRMYHRLFKQLEKDMATPDLIIYLSSSIENVYGRIKSRERDFETQGKKDEFIDYLTVLTKNNEEWMSRMSKKIPIVTIDINNFNYIRSRERKQDMKEILHRYFKHYSIV